MNWSKIEVEHETIDDIVHISLAIDGVYKVRIAIPESDATDLADTAVMNQLGRELRKLREAAEE